jgi:hypothetical protein
MRFAAIAGLLVSALGAQVMPPPAPVTRGVVLERDPQPAGGEFSIRLDNYEVLRYRFDGRTTVDRENYPIDVPRLRPGERVEVLSDAVPGSLVRYASAVHALDRAHQPARRPPARGLTAGLSNAYLNEDTLFARGNLTFAGVISRLDAGRLVLRTRQGERTVLLRDDTCYLDNGEISAAAALSPNMRVFVRAGRNLYDEFEGYQVVWGQILEPK